MQWLLKSLSLIYWDVTAEVWDSKSAAYRILKLVAESCILAIWQTPVCRGTSGLCFCRDTDNLGTNAALPTVLPKLNLETKISIHLVKT